MSRRFNRGGDNDSDYLRCLLSSGIAHNNVSMAGCFARELDDGNFQTIAQMGTTGSDNNRVILGIPSSSDTIRAAQVNNSGTTVQASTTGAVTAQRFYVGCGRWISATSRVAERTGAATASNSTSNTPTTAMTELLIARKSVVSVTFESWPGWLQWVAFWRVAISASESAALCQQWEDPRKIRPDALIALVDFKDYRPVYYAPRNSLLFNVVGDPDWETYGPYTLRTKRRRIFVPTSGGASSGDMAATEAADTFAASGDVLAAGDLNVSEASDTAAIAGDVIAAGDLNVSEASDTFAASGDVLAAGDLNVSEAPDTFAASGEVLAAGDLIASEAADTFAAAGDVITAGDLAASEAPDTFAATGDVLAAGDLAASEAEDVAAIDVTALEGGRLIAVDQPDTFAATGDVLAAGDLAASEAGDSAAIAGDVLAQGDLAASEEADSAAIEATAPHANVGDLIAIEAEDLASITGEVAGTIVFVTDTEAIAKVKAREVLRTAMLTRLGTYAKKPSEIDHINLEFADASRGTITAEQYYGRLNKADREHVNLGGRLPQEI